MQQVQPRSLLKLVNSLANLLCEMSSMPWHTSSANPCNGSADADDFLLQWGSGKLFVECNVGDVEHT